MNALPPLTLVLGGARSGKSRYAETLVLRAFRPSPEVPAPLYLATATAGDDEMADRIARHRHDRDERWTTLEEPLDLAGVIRRAGRADRPILIDCLTLWLMNLMTAERAVEPATDALLAACAESASPLVLVANEIGLGLVPDSALAREFRDHAGRINQKVAAQAASVVFIAAGLPLVLKDRRGDGT